MKIMNEEKFIDVSHLVEDRMITYKGLPAPIICDFLSREASKSHYAPGTEFQIGKIEMVANTGTYIDAPFHRFSGRKDLADLPLDSLADLPGRVIRVPAEGRAIVADVVAGLELAGRAVLFHTGWSRHWRTDQYFEGHPFLTRSAAEALVAAQCEQHIRHVDQHVQAGRLEISSCLDDGVRIAHEPGQDGCYVQQVDITVRRRARGLSAVPYGVTPTGRG